MRSCWRRYGTVFLSIGFVAGRPRFIQDYHEYELLEYLRERPMAYLDQLQYHLFDAFDSLPSGELYTVLTGLESALGGSHVNAISTYVMVSSRSCPNGDLISSSF